MQRTEHKMPGEGGLDAHLCCFLVTHLTDHDDIGVGTKKSAHGSGEGITDTWLNLNLPEPILGNLNRVFRGPDLFFRCVDVIEG